MRTVRKWGVTLGRNAEREAMPLRSNATARQERLGTELRKMREAAGVTARDTARLLGADPAKVSHIEAGRLGVSEARLRRLAAFYACGDGPLVDALVALAKQQRGRGWWERYRGTLPAPLLDLSELEFHATYLRAIQVTHIPGTFQTEDYARTVFGHTIPELPVADLEARVAHRMERRNIFLREGAPRYEAIVHEAALRMRFGGRKISREQLQYLLELSQQPNLRVRVVPFDAEGYFSSGHAMLYAGGLVPKLDTVQIEAGHGIRFLDAESHLKNYRTLFDRVEVAALSDAESRDFILGVAHEL
jgi:transcriptional regulator with XRE-family HTH domain